MSVFRLQKYKIIQSESFFFAKKDSFADFSCYFCRKYVSNQAKTYSLMNLGTPEIILIALVVLLLFGGKKIPELMKGLGKGVKSFKDGVKGLDDEIKEATEIKDETK